MLFFRLLFPIVAFLRHNHTVLYNPETFLTLRHFWHIPAKHSFRNPMAEFRTYNNHLGLQQEPCSSMSGVYCKARFLYEKRV